MKKVISRARLASAVFAVLALSLASFAQETAPDKSRFPQIKIKNFGQMDERFYRGAQPEPEDYKALAALGISTVIDLRAEAEDYARGAAEAAGLRYVNIPMRQKTYPTEQEVAGFLKVVNDTATGKFYVHCAGGRHRTGSMGAVYRYNFYGWDLARVYREMKNYDFYTRWGHGDYKQFVEDYGQRAAALRAAPATVTPAVTAATAGVN